VKDLSKQVSGIRAWKNRIDSVKSKLGRSRGHPKELHPLHGRLVKMEGDAPEGYTRKAVSDLLNKLTVEYEKAALQEVAQAAKRAGEALRRNDLRDALTAWATIPVYYGKDLPEVRAEIDKHKGVMEDTAAKRAQKELGRARLATGKRQERQALAILRQAWPEYKGFKIAGKIVEREREAALAVLKVLCADASGTARKIDRELFDLMETSAPLRPDVREDRTKIRAFLGKIDKIMDRYRAALEEFSMSAKEFELRRARLEKFLRWERKRLAED
jgi:hypothetical protein